MDFPMHIKILRSVRANIATGVLIRHIYELIQEHEGTDFKDLDDFFTKLYPNCPPKWGKSPFYGTSAVEPQ